MSKHDMQEELATVFGTTHNVGTIANYIRNKIEGARDYQRCVSGRWYHLRNGVWEEELQFPRAAASLIHQLCHVLFIDDKRRRQQDMVATLAIDRAAHGIAH